jgi:DNA-binding transcriptional ArsR family regulator
MTDKKTVSISSDQEFIRELSEYLEVLSNPVRLKILQFIAREPQETTEIARHIGTTYQNAKKHLDRLITTGLVKREAGFGRETERGIAPVWKFSIAPGGLETLVRTLGIFYSVTIPQEFKDIDQRIKAVQSAVMGKGEGGWPVLYLINGPAEGYAYILKKDRMIIGRGDPALADPVHDTSVVLPDAYSAVTRITKPHAVITRTGTGWQIEDRGSTGGTFVNAQRLVQGKEMLLSTGDVIDLSLGSHGARLLFVSPE